MKESPYLKYDNRLADVIAAIQVMGIYKFYKLDFSQWADRISGDINETAKWENVFIEHPEFFRIDQTKKKVSLVWRRNYPKNFDVDTRNEISKSDFLALSDEKKARISRNPLKNDDITMLIESAISLHSRALQLKQDKRWWVPVLIGVIAGVISTIANIVMGSI
ncbi:N-carbamoyl-L-amino acid amidohydrolase [Winogradskyella undariae]|uniref:N-carbamoyl-L-amino acid amidohydrolase n=1 Tax=Winogradskyella undariae TaxID=1285465 RepID=UPI00156BAD73|nr:N-carbamoyl-L-amino acid amidohydrolase [Winogradskyella undariae]NRR92391.1 N-carbamoyl-L-amino acid amidohydrolase [Winogradskyella undariae]